MKTTQLPLCLALATSLFLSTSAGQSADNEKLPKSERATLKVPKEALTGQTLSIEWTGPNGGDDIIALVKPEAENSDFGVFAKTSAGNPAKIEAPDKIGKYEIRYVTGRELVLASQPITLVAATATVKSNAPLVGGGTGVIQWTGPNEEGDFIAIVLAGSEGSDLGGMAPTKDGNPAKVAVPDEPGAYDIRYVRGSDQKILASTPATVVSSEREDEIQEGVGD